MNLWIYLIILVGIVVISLFLPWLFYIIADFLMKHRIKKQYKKLLNNPERNKEMLNPGKTKIDTKEVLDNERKSSIKYREFEKLRRYESTGRKRVNSPGSSPRGEPQANPVELPKQDSDKPRNNLRTLAEKLKLKK